MRFDDAIRNRFVRLACLVIVGAPFCRAVADDASWSGTPDVWPVPLNASSGVTSALGHSQDGLHLAIGLSSGEVVVMGASDGQVVRRWPAHAERINALVFIAEDHRLITASDDGTLKLWTVKSGAEERTFSGHTSWVTAVSASADGQIFASGSYDRSIRVWSHQTDPKASFELSGHQAGVKDVDFRRDGKQIVTASADKTAIVWNLETRQSVLTIKGHQGILRASKFSPDGLQIATASEDGSVRLWNSQTGERSHALVGHAGMVWALAYAPTGNLLASGGFDQTTRLWNPQGGKRVAVLRGPKTPICGLAFSLDGETLFVAGQEQNVYRYRARRGENAAAGAAETETKP